MTRKNNHQPIKKIGIVSGYFVPHVGGVERYTDKLSAELKKRGYEIVIITSNYADLPDRQESGGRTIYRLPVLKLFKDRYPLPRLGLKFRNIKHAIKNEDIDLFVINTRFYLISLMGARLGKSLGKPVFLIEHGSAHLTVGNKLLDYLGSIYEHGLTFVLKRYIDRYFGVSEACCQWLGHFGIKASGVLYNAVDPSDVKSTSHRFEKINGDEIVIAYAGRLIAQKGIINLLEAFRIVKSQTTKPLRLVVAGDGDLFDVIKKNYGQDDIDIVGRLVFRDVLSLMKRADIFVLPSLHPEGLPTAVLEAGLMNCAVVSTPAGGAKEIINSPEVGLMIDGSKSSLEPALLKLINNRALRDNVAAGLNRRVKDHFTWQQTADELVSQIDDLKSGSRL